MGQELVYGSKAYDMRFPYLLVRALYDVQRRALEWHRGLVYDFRFIDVNTCLVDAKCFISLRDALFWSDHGGRRLGSEKNEDGGKQVASLYGNTPFLSLPNFEKAFRQRPKDIFEFSGIH